MKILNRLFRCREVQTPVSHVPAVGLRQSPAPPVIRRVGDLEFDEDGWYRQAGQERRPRLQMDVSGSGAATPAAPWKTSAEMAAELRRNRW